MDSAPVLRPSPQKSPFRPPYDHELHIENNSSDEDPYSYEVSPDEAIFDDEPDDSQESQSPHTSEDDLISEFPGDGDSRAPSTIYTPHKRRSPFRHPSSVRNLQLDTTPPHLASPLKSLYHLSPSPHSRNSTPRSVYSTHSRPRSTRSSPSRKEKPKKTKKERPLVLLHFTLLPYKLPYSQALLESVLPASKLADGKLLKEKLSQSVVQERGVLIPHPRDDYDLLEERLLEALELEQGALTRDGHFLIPEERGTSRASRSFASTRHDDKDDAGQTSEEHARDEERTELGEEDSQNLCEDCGKQLHIVGADRRWDIKVYAANGLMREGAWGAAWHEMERVDVEIQPFISDETKRELEIRVEEMDLLLQAEQRDSAARHHEEAAVEVLQATEDTVSSHRDSGLDAQRMREIYGDDVPESTEASVYQTSEEALRSRTQASVPSKSTKDVPLSTLLSNYVQLTLQDRRNIAIGFLTIVTLLLAMIVGQSKQGSSSLANMPAQVSSSFSSAVASSIPTQATGDFAAVVHSVHSAASDYASPVLSSPLSSSTSTVISVADSASTAVNLSESIADQQTSDLQEDVTSLENASQDVLYQASEGEATELSSSEVLSSLSSDAEEESESTDEDSDA